MLSKAELRKLIRAHNVLSKITVPKGASLDDMVKLVEKAGYKVNHEKKRLDAQVKRGKQITLKQAEEITAPKPKTTLQKQKAQEKKEEKAVEQKKKEREIRKTAVAEEKKRQGKMPKKDIKDKTQSISKVEKKKMPPKITAEQMKSIKVIERKEKRQIIITEGEKGKAPEKETKVPIDKLFDRVVSIVENRGYKMTDKQKKELQEDHINNFLLDPDDGRGEKATRYYIFKGKGKTDMLILSPDDELGGGLASIRVKKEDVKKEEKKEEVDESKPFFWNYGNDDGLEYGTSREVGTTPEQMIKAITDKNFKVSKKAEKEIAKFMKDNANKNDKERVIVLFQKTDDINFGTASGNQKLKKRVYKWNGISFGNPFS